MKEYELKITGFGNGDVDMHYIGPLSKLKEFLSGKDYSSKEQSEERKEIVKKALNYLDSIKDPVMLEEPITLSQIHEKADISISKLQDILDLPCSQLNDHVVTEEELKLISEKTNKHFVIERNGVFIPL